MGCVGAGLCPARGRPRGSPLRRTMSFLPPGRCGERTERCQWQKQRSERVAAVKISSVRRKAAQKFWAPQQDHRPLRMRCRKCGEVGDRKGRPYGKRLPLSGEPLGGTDCHTSVRTGFAMTGFLQGERWVSLWCVGEGGSAPPAGDRKGRPYGGL